MYTKFFIYTKSKFIYQALETVYIYQLAIYCVYIPVGNTDCKQPTIFDIDSAMRAGNRLNTFCCTDVIHPLIACEHCDDRKICLLCYRFTTANCQIDIIKNRFNGICQK